MERSRSLSDISRGDVSAGEFHPQQQEQSASTSHPPGAPPSAQYQMVDGMPGRVSRSSASTVPAGLLVKIGTQQERISLMHQLGNTAKTGDQRVSRRTAEIWMGDVRQLYDEFKKEHALLESLCPVALYTHDYFVKKATHLAYQAYFSASAAISTLIDSLPQQSSSQSSSTTSSRSNLSNLPKIDVPVFSGECLEWVGFKELFTSLVINNEALGDVERLHYLRSSLKGDPAQLIAGYPLSAESFSKSWDTLEERYANPRMLLAQYLGAMYRLQPMSAGQPDSMCKVTSEYRRLRQLISGVGSPTEILETVFCDSFMRLVDRVSAEQWESSLPRSCTFPSCESFEDCVLKRAQDLKLVRAPHGVQKASTVAQQQQRPARATNALTGQASQSQQTTSKPQQTSTASSTPQASSTAHAAGPPTISPCAYCKGKHFVAKCSQFWALSVDERYDFAQGRPLCYNCLGFHAAAKCNNPKRCTECQAHHHTLLHGATHCCM